MSIYALIHYRKEQDMTNKAQDFLFRLSVNLPSIYTAAHLFCGIPIIKSINVGNLPENLCGKLTLSIQGRCADREILDFRFVIPDFRACEYLAENSDTAVFNLEKHKIMPDASFVNELTVNTPVRIRISMTVGDMTASCMADVKISPFGHICPEMPPELICTYVLPACEFAAKAEALLQSRTKTITQKHRRTVPKPLLYAEALASVILSAKLTYSAIHREMPDGDCIIRDPDSLTESTKRSMSQTEAALLYCSCAERCGLHPGIIFLRKGAGSIKVLVSIGLGDYHPGSPVSESISELRTRILDREIFVFDVLGLLGTEDTDFARNVTETTNLVLKSSSALIYSIDVYTSRLCGVSSLRHFDGVAAKDIYGGYQSISDAVKRIDKNADSVSVYGFSPYSSVSLGLCIPGNKLSFGNEYTLCPLDDELICSDTEAFLKFSSLKPKTLSGHPRNMTEQALYDTKLGDLSSKVFSGLKKDCIYVYPPKYILSGAKLTPERIRDEVYSDAVKICDTVKVDSLGSGKAEIYAAVGCVCISDDNADYYAPCVYVPCEITAESNGIKLKYGTEKPIVNRSLANHIEKETGVNFRLRRELIMSESGKKATDTGGRYLFELNASLAAFASVCEEFTDKFRFITDTFLSIFDLSYTFMRDCLEKADGKKFEQYLECGRYTPCESREQLFGRYESTLPFAVPSDVRNAVRGAETDSIIISGPHGSGKKKALGNILARTALRGGDLLICSKYTETLDSVYETLKKCGIDELCLPVKGSTETKKRIADDIERLFGEPEFPDIARNSDPGSCERILADGADDLYSEYGFGFSLYDCIDKYCRYSLECEEEPIPLSLEIRDLSGEGADKLFGIADRLISENKKISDMCSGQMKDVFGFLKHIKNTEALTEDIKNCFKNACKQLDIFAEKSTFARNCLGIPESAITDVRTLLSLGEFLELIMKSGIDYLPEELLSGSTCRSAKTIERCCEIIDGICSCNAYLADVSGRIASLSCTELYARWKEAENNPFVKNSIIHEIKKYLSENDVFTSGDIEEKLRKLSEREALEKELSLAAPEASVSLGKIWQGCNTDTERARRIARFATGADICLKKLFRNTSDSTVELHRGITRLISNLSEDKCANADFVLSVSAFRKLHRDNAGILPELSEKLCCDLYEIKFKNGILGKNGLSYLLRIFGENTAPLLCLHNLNTAKKEAVSVGLSDIVRYIENTPCSPSLSAVVYKSIFLAFANYIIKTKPSLSDGTLLSKREEYMELYMYEKQLASFNQISLHRRKFRDYISDDEGKSSLYALREALNDPNSSVFDILADNTKLLKCMYSAILTTNTTAYRLGYYPSELVLLDCEKTDAAEGLPLCANFDKCIFITSPFERVGSIMSSLPLGLPSFTLTKVLSEKNGYLAAFEESLFPGTLSPYLRERNNGTVKFVKCQGGLYDKNVRANKIEALHVCELSLAAAGEYGFENVGIIAMTIGQALEISGGLRILANKYSQSEIAHIPVRYIGNIGDFSKDCIIFSAAFGKNIYSVTRSFSVADDISLMHSGNPICMSELLCCGKYLYIVSSTEPEDIMTDTLCKGAPAIASLTAFAKYGAVPVSIDASTSDEKTSDIKNMLCDSIFRKNPKASVRTGNGTISYGNRALIFEDGYIRDAYDRIILPLKEAKARGYTAEYSDICRLIEKH